MQAKENPDIENISWKVLAYGIYARVVDVSEIERMSAANEFFVVFWRSKGRGAMPQGHENKGNKTIRKKEKQKARVTYRVKRPPKREGAPPYGASPANEFFVVFWRSKGRGAMPQGHENKGNKTIRQKEKQKARVTYRVKRPPKWEGAPPYGASPPTSPGNRTPPPY